MTVDVAERAKQGYLLGKDEGDAFYLLGMLEIVKIGRQETNGAYGLMEVEPATERVVPPPLDTPPDMQRLIPIAARNGMNILGPPGPPPAK